LVSDGRNHFTHTHDSAQLYRFGEINPYVEAFFKWWESDLHQTLQELRITGGEPLMSAETWKLIDWFKNNPGRSNTRLAINSNLGADVDVDRLIESTQGLDVEIYTSMEAVGLAAEYIRDGLDYREWEKNVVKLLDSHVGAVHVMATINALCLPTLSALLHYVVQLKSKYGRERVNFTLNILRFPSFQSTLVLPKKLLTRHMSELSSFLHRWQAVPDILHEHEINHLQRLIDYLDVVKTPHSDAFDLPKLHNDFKQFYTQYDQRRGKDFGTAFPSLTEWFNNDIRTTS
jgi:uncharacterized protein Usg